MGFFFLLIGCSRPTEYIHINGSTMGTTYNIKMNSSNNNYDINQIKDGIDSILIHLNSVLSTWDENSEISIFNKTIINKPFQISNTLNTVIEHSLNISDETDGYFDVTIHDLMSLWGFGPNPKIGIPNKKNIDSVLHFTGFEKLHLEDRAITKNQPFLKLDLNAIAKGYGVDIVFEYLKTEKFENLFVEIGGEVRCKGKNSMGNIWSIGIETPNSEKNNSPSFIGIVELEDFSMATSGNYRNFIDYNGEILGHTINPKTGFPTKSNLLSVTVFSTTCMIADAWATALMVMDYDTGFKKIKDIEGVKVLWILEEKDGSRVIRKYGDLKIINPIYKIIV